MQMYVISEEQQLEIFHTVKTIIMIQEKKPDKVNSVHNEERKITFL